MCSIVRSLSAGAGAGAAAAPPRCAALFAAPPPCAARFATHLGGAAPWAQKHPPLQQRGPLAAGAAAPAQPELCVIVDEQNQVVGVATRRETVSMRLLGRGAYVLVFNGAGELFVSKRSSRKDCYPGRLDVTISGVVNMGEEYSDTAARELREEIGIPAQEAAARLQQLFVFPYQDEVCHVWGCAFRVEWDGPVAFGDEEVEWGRFMALRELQERLGADAGAFTPVGRHILRLYLERRQQGSGGEQQQQQQQQQQQ